MMLAADAGNRRDLGKTTLEFVRRECPHRTIGFVTREVRGTSGKRLIFCRKCPGLSLACADLGRGWFGIVGVNNVFDVAIEHGLTNLGRRMFGQGSSNGTDHEDPHEDAKDDQRRDDLDP